MSIDTIKKNTCQVTKDVTVTEFRFELYLDISKFL